MPQTLHSHPADWPSLTEAAALLSMSRPALTKALAAQGLEPTKVGSSKRVSPQQLIVLAHADDDATKITLVLGQLQEYAEQREDRAAAARLAEDVQQFGAADEEAARARVEQLIVAAIETVKQAQHETVVTAAKAKDAPEQAAAKAAAGARKVAKQAKSTSKTAAKKSRKAAKQAKADSGKKVTRAQRDAVKRARKLRRDVKRAVASADQARAAERFARQAEKDARQRVSDAERVTNEAVAKAERAARKAEQFAAEKARNVGDELSRELNKTAQLVSTKLSIRR